MADFRYPWKNVLSAWSGWLIDGYISLTFLLTIVSTPSITQIYFPSSDFYGQSFLFATLGFVLTSGIPRFVGSGFLGNFIGDRLGRRNLLIVTVPVFSFANLMIFFVPSFARIGYLSPMLIYTIALVIGFFAGAEYGGGAALSMESVPAEKRLLTGAFVQSGYGTGFVLIAFTSFILSSHLGTAAYDSYGFRYLFLISVIPALISLTLRYSSKETEVFDNMQEKKEIEKVPFIAMITSEGKKSLYGFLTVFIIIAGLLTVNTATFSYYFIVLLHDSFSANFAKYDFVYIMIINSVSIAGVFFGALLALKIIARKESIFIFSVIFFIISIPAVH